MEEKKPPSGWDRVMGLFFGLTFCGLMWALFSYLLPVVMSGQGWVPAGTGAWGGIVLMGLGITGIAGLCWSLLQWARVDFGPVTAPVVLRVLTFSLVLIAIAVQLAFTFFLLGIIDMPSQRKGSNSA